SSSSSSLFCEGLDRELLLFLTTQGNQSSSQSPSSTPSSPYRSHLHWGCLNASEISGPAAIAVGLAFLDSDNEEARQGLRIPNDLDQLLDLLPHVLMC
ncbi:proteasome cyclosome repeat-containing protein, partial [Cystoisospora suis]